MNFSCRDVLSHLDIGPQLYGPPGLLTFETRFRCSPTEATGNEYWQLLLPGKDVQNAKQIEHFQVSSEVHITSLI